MTTMDMAKEAFASRRAVDAWFKDAAPNFEAFAEMVRKEERDKCATVVFLTRLESEADDAPDHGVGNWLLDLEDAMRKRSNV